MAARRDQLAAHRTALEVRFEIARARRRERAIEELCKLPVVGTRRRAGLDLA